MNLLTRHRIARDLRPPEMPCVFNKGCVQAQGLVAFWPLGYNGPSELGLFGNELTNNGTTLDTDSDFGRVRVFGASGETDLKNTSFSPITAEPVTLACWFKVTTIGVNQNMLVIGDVGANEAFGIGVLGAANNPIAYRANSGTFKIATGAQVVATATPYHICGSFPSDSLRTVYLNAAGPVSETTPLGVNALTRTKIGSFITDGGSTDYTRGIIAHACVWNRELSEDEIRELYDPKTRWQLYYPVGIKTFSFPKITSAPVSVTPTPSYLVTQSVDPTSVLGSLTVVPNNSNLITLSVDPTTVLGSLTVVPNNSNLITLSVDPSVVLGSLALTPTQIYCILASIDPSIILGSLTVVPNNSNLITSTVDPSVILGSLTVVPSSADVILVSVDPTVQSSGLTVSPTATYLICLAVDPSVILGSISVTPNNSNLVVQSVDPSIILGSVSVTPNPLTTILSNVDPSVILGSLAYTPTPANTILTSVNPTIILEGITYTPAAISTVLASVDPSVILGSITLTPAVAYLVVTVRGPIIGSSKFIILNNYYLENLNA